MVVEEILYQTWYMSPAMGVGTEGAWGLVIYVIVLGITCNVKCTKANSLCLYNPNKQ